MSKSGIKSRNYRRNPVFFHSRSITSVLGLIHTGAGVALTFALAFVHIRVNKEMPVRPLNVLVQQVSGQSPMLQRVEESTQETADAE